MRIKSTLLNSLSNFIILLTKTLLVFLVRKIFLQTLGLEILGADGLLINILAVLAVAELGIGEAISYSLYKPIKDNDTQKISLLMTLYRDVYKVIGIVVLLIGTIIYFFLGYFNLSTINHLTIIYFLYLFNTVFIYFISYKETLIIADQKKYKLAKFETMFLIIMNISQIIALISTKNYIFYLIIMVICNLLQRILVNRYISKLYPDISFNCTKKLDKKEVDKLKKNVKGLIFHKIGDYLINGTDNIILSTFSIIAVGLYSNYLLVSNAVKSFLLTIFNAMVPTLGNLIVSESKDVQENTFQMINFLGFILFGYSTICLALLSNSFIEIAFGKEYLLSNTIVLIIALNVFLSGLRIINCTIVNAAGITYKTRFDALFQALLNIIISVALVFKFGILGVLIGTMASGILIPNWHTPIVIYRDLFEKKFILYVKVLFKNILILVISGGICFKISTLFTISILSFILQAIIYFIIFIICVLIFYFKSNQLNYYLNILKGVVKKNEKEIS